jgi:hypothetical protein
MSGLERSYFRFERPDTMIERSLDRVDDGIHERFEFVLVHR